LRRAGRAGSESTIPHDAGVEHTLLDASADRGDGPGTGWELEIVFRSAAPNIVKVPTLVLGACKAMKKSSSKSRR
jgi:hypothetical protein